MTNVALKVSDDFKSRIERLPWINWSEIAREEALKQIKLAEVFERFKKIVSKSKLTEKDAKELADKMDEGMLKELRKRFPGL